MTTACRLPFQARTERDLNTNCRRFLHGTVPDLAPEGDFGRGFALLYTGVIGAGGLAPIAYGAIVNHSNRTVGVLAAALTAALVIPLVLAPRTIVEDERGALAEQES